MIIFIFLILFISLSSEMDYPVGCEKRETLVNDNFDIFNHSLWRSWGNYTISNEICGSDEGNSINIFIPGDATSGNQVLLKSEIIECQECTQPIRYQLTFWFLVGRKNSETSGDKYPNCEYENEDNGEYKDGDSLYVVLVFPLASETEEYWEFYPIHRVVLRDYNKYEPSTISSTFWSERDFQIWIRTNTLEDSDSVVAFDSFKLSTFPGEVQCDDHGKCQEDLSCKCDDGFDGFECTQQMCDSDKTKNRQICNNNGNCYINNNIEEESLCECDRGYNISTKCEEALCDEDELLFFDTFNYLDSTKWDFSTSFGEDINQFSIFPSFNCGTENNDTESPALILGFKERVESLVFSQVKIMTKEKRIMCTQCDLSKTKVRFRFWFVLGRAKTDPVKFWECYHDDAGDGHKIFFYNYGYNPGSEEWETVNTFFTISPYDVINFQPRVIEFTVDLKDLIDPYEHNNNNNNNEVGDYNFRIGIERKLAGNGYFAIDNFEITRLSEDPSEFCHGRGHCKTPFDSTDCACNDGYFGKTCEMEYCYIDDLPKNREFCTNHGTCYLEDTGKEKTKRCLCDDDDKYSGGNCGNWDCYGISNKITSKVCSGNGVCIDTNNCSCVSTNYDGDKCDQFSCFGLANDHKDVCNGQGICMKYNNCSCHYSSKEYGIKQTQNCSIWPCDPISNRLIWNNDNTSEICSGHGHCIAPDTCSCFGEYFGDDCDGFTCDGKIVCSGHGNCTAPNTCECDHGYTDQKCDNFTCFGINKDSTDVCHYRGVCRSYDNCECTGFTKVDKDCNVFPCNYYGDDDDEIIYNNDTMSTKICYGNGDCISPWECQCKPGYETDKTGCSQWTCDGVQRTSPNVCSSHGDCTSFENCKCYSSNYHGKYCSDFFCFGVDHENNNVCQGHGSCIDYNLCFCDKGYSPQSSNTSDCSEYLCYTIEKGEENVCSGHGECISSNNCSCNQGYFSKECDDFKCFKLVNTASDVCSGHGKCVEPDNCVCDKGYETKLDCSVGSSKKTPKKNDTKNSEDKDVPLGIIIGSVAGGIVLVSAVFCCVCVVFLLAVVLLVVAFVLIVGVVFGGPSVLSCFVVLLFGKKNGVGILDPSIQGDNDGDYYDSLKAPEIYF